MPLHLQTRLLRVLEERRVTRVGGHQPIDVEFRVISATHCNLDRDIAEGRFRADLFYRLSALRLPIPPLRARGEDIRLLARESIYRALAAMAVTPGEPLARRLEQYITPLLDYTWPGNIRELRNVAERLALLLANGGPQDARDLKMVVPEIYARQDAAPSAAPMTASETLAQCKGDRQAAARRLGISRTTLWRRLKEEQG